MGDPLITVPDVTVPIEGPRSRIRDIRFTDNKEVLLFENDTSLQAWSFKDPSSPEHEGHFRLEDKPLCMDHTDEFVMIGYGEHAEIIHFSDEKPEKIYTNTELVRNLGCRIDDGKAYFSSRQGLTVVELSDPEKDTLMLGRNTITSLHEDQNMGVVFQTFSGPKFLDLSGNGWPEVVAEYRDYDSAPALNLMLGSNYSILIHEAKGVQLLKIESSTFFNQGKQSTKSSNLPEVINLWHGFSGGSIDLLGRSLH